MSLELRLLAYQGGGTRGDRIVRASFRGKYNEYVDSLLLCANFALLCLLMETKWYVLSDEVSNQKHYTLATSLYHHTWGKNSNHWLWIND